MPHIVMGHNHGTPLAPDAGHSALYVKPNGRLYILDESGNEIEMAGELMRLSDFEGKEGTATIFGEVVTAKKEDFINIQFQYDISSSDTKTTLTGTGVAEHIGEARAQVRCGTGVGFSKIESLDAIRYIPGKEIVANFTAYFPNAEAGVNQIAGVFDVKNGVAVGYQGTTFGVWFIRDGVYNFTPSSSFNAVTDGYTVDASGMRIYRITYGWLGVAPITVSVFAGWQEGWKRLHVIDHSGNTAPHLINPVLPIAIAASRESGTGADIGPITSSWRGGIIGERPHQTTADRPFLKYIKERSIAQNVLTPILSIRNKSTFHAMTNHVRARIDSLYFGIEGSKDVFVTLYKNEALTGASFVDANANQSVCEYDTSATAITTASEPIAGFVLQKNLGGQFNSADGLIALIRPGDTVSICVESSGVNEVSLLCKHIEEF